MMGILYIITLIILGISFMMFKKSNEKINFIKWLIIYIVSLLGYNILIGMVLGLLNITSHIWLLSIINLIVALGLSYRVIRYKEIQKYFVTKLDVAGIIIILVIFSVMFVKDLYIYNGDISHWAVDSAVHYRAAKHYSDNLKIFINVEDKTFFNFNVMQPGAYINDGIFMNVINSITGIDHCYLYQMFETLVMFVSGLAFYAAFMEKIKTKRGLIGSLILFALYIYGYPYNSWIYGFSYLSVGITMISMLLAVVPELYSEQKINKILVITLIGILGMGLIFSYCLFVPAIFAAICIYTFLKDFSMEGKTYLKFFKKNTLIVTVMLLIVTAVGIGYLFIPTFFIEGQTNLVSALKIGGQIYDEKVANILPYIPFAILYAVEVFKRIKEKNLRYMDVFSIIVVGFWALLYIGMMYNLVSPYYMIKVYFILWIVVFAVTIDMLNKYIDEKNFRVDAILVIALYVLLIYSGTNSAIKEATKPGATLPVQEILRQKLISIGIIYAGIVLAFYTVLPDIIKNINSNKIKKLREIRTTGFVYVLIWGLFVCFWVNLKGGHLIGETEKHLMPNLVGIYYTENTEFRKLIDLNNNLNANEIKIVNYARENISDLNADNIQLITSGYYTRIWTTAMLEISSDNISYEEFVQDTKKHTVEEALKDESKKYIVQVVSKEQTQLDEYNKNLKEFKDIEQIEIVYENENGFVAKINR